MRGRRNVHDELLDEGARTAPEPETAEERSRRVGLKTGGAVIVGGAAAAAKLGVLGKGVLWFLAFHGVINAWRLGMWTGFAVVLVALAVLVFRRARREG